MALKEAQTEEACWNVLSRHSLNFGFSSAKLFSPGELDPRHLSAVSGGGPHWSLCIDMPNGDQVVLVRACGAGQNTMVAHFADVTQELLAKKNWPARRKPLARGA